MLVLLAKHAAHIARAATYFSNNLILDDASCAYLLPALKRGTRAVTFPLPSRVNGAVSLKPLSYRISTYHATCIGVGGSAC